MACGGKRGEVSPTLINPCRESKRDKEKRKEKMKEDRK